MLYDEMKEKSEYGQVKNNEGMYPYGQPEAERQYGSLA